MLNFSNAAHVFKKQRGSFAARADALSMDMIFRKLIADELDVTHASCGLKSYKSQYQ